MIILLNLHFRCVLSFNHFVHHHHLHYLFGFDSKLRMWIETNLTTILTKEKKNKRKLELIE